MENFKLWFSEHPNSTNIIKFLIWILMVFVVVAWIRRFLKKNLPDNSIKYKTQKGVEVVG